MKVFFKPQSAKKEEFVSFFKRNYYPCNSFLTCFLRLN